MPLDYMVLIYSSQMFSQNIYKNPRKEGMKGDRNTGRKEGELTTPWGTRWAQILKARLLSISEGNVW